MKKLRRVTEHEVIAEFLKNEFHEEEFHRDRKHFQHLVMEADVANEAENAVRKALLFRRRGHMWRELPLDTQWWEVQVEADDLERIRVFPRAQWRKVARGRSFLLPDIVERIRRDRLSGKNDEFISKIQSLSTRLRFESEVSSVLLIGVDESSPFTIIEGNHRAAAALLASPAAFHERFRVFCGLSPNMTQSCWYRSSLANLWRYARHRLKHLFHDPDCDVERALEKNAPLLAGSKRYAEAVSSHKAMPEAK